MDFDTDRLRDVKDAVTETLSDYTEERREAVDELAEYGGGGAEGYAFAALALARNYEAAASLIDADPAVVEQEVEPVVNDLYDDARKGKEAAHEAKEEAQDVLTPLKEAYRDDDADLADMVDAAKQVKEDATLRAQQRATEYAMERAMRQMEADMEEAFGGLDGMMDGLEGAEEPTDVGDLFDADEDADDPLGLGGTPVQTSEAYDDTMDEDVTAFLARDDVFEHYQQVRTVVDRIEDPDAFGAVFQPDIRDEEFYKEAVEHTAFEDPDAFGDAFEDAVDARMTLLQKGLTELDDDAMSTLQDELDQLYGER